ncbi:psbP domain-containing protein 2, chloroplastic isoform X2 [Cryptomeria japonica]|uniref:psbP domain-containing protein 2, chloroplastic isoform X2 n=1 Tax=Cryptomeria japonica TaxID=3369 RepID=UPI0027DA1A4A|nr:psbP domain-containing protein 2, chloroplastic isoform X2 [Cryptomeria japonica]
MKTTLLQTTCPLSHLTSSQYHAHYFSLFSSGQQGLKCSVFKKSEQRHLKLAVNHERISTGRNYHDKSDGIRKLHTRREGLLSLSLCLPLSLSASVSISLPQLAKGATVLFEDPVVKSNNIGVVVNPIRISSLKEFGTPQVVAEKLLQAEKKKPSTNDARLIKVDQRPIHGDIPLYELEYALDSSRGIKRVLSAVTIASKKLYLLNIAYSDSPEKPLLPNTRMLLEQVLNSFDVLS